MTDKPTRPRIGFSQEELQQGLPEIRGPIHQPLGHRAGLDLGNGLRLGIASVTKGELAAVSMVIRSSDGKIVSRVDYNWQPMDTVVADAGLAGAIYHIVQDYKIGETEKDAIMKRLKEQFPTEFAKFQKAGGFWHEMKDVIVPSATPPVDLKLPNKDTPRKV